MGKVIRDTAASASSEDQRRKTVRVEQKVRAKKKKRKRDLTDLHEKLYKSKKSKETKITGKLCRPRNSKKICNRILPRPLTGIYRNGATGKEIRRSQTKAPVNDINNARLQGNVLKLLNGYDSKSKGIVLENNTEGDPKDPLLDPTIKSILHPTPPGSERISPVLGKADGPHRCQKDDQAAKGPSKLGAFLDKCLEKKPQNHPENFRSAVSRYEELCATISVKNFEGQNILEQFTADPLITVKKKLRSIYAESFRNQFLRDMIKRNTTLNRYETPNLSPEYDFPSETTCGTEAEILSAAEENPGRRDRRGTSEEENKSQGPSTLLLVGRSLNLNGNWNQVPTPHLLFDLSLLHGPSTGTGLETIAESEQDNRATENKSDNNLTRGSQYLPSSLDVNHSAMSTSTRSSSKYFENPAPQNRTERLKKSSKAVLFLPNEAESSNDFVSKKHSIKRRNQRTQTMHSLNSAARRDSGKHAFKASQQVKAMSQKHIPAILRRCSSNNRVNLFAETMESIEEPREVFLHPALKQNDLFDPGALISELNRTSKALERSASANALFEASSLSDLDVQTCVIASPSLRKDGLRFARNPYSEAEPKQRLQSINEILPGNKQRDPPVHKTIMFTRKDSRNIGHCLHVNNLISDGAAGNPNVCLKRKSLPQQQEKPTKDCSTHRNCQRVSGNCYRSFHCSQSTDTSNYSSQEFKEPGVAQEEPVVCETVLLRRMQQHQNCESNQNCHEKDQRFCYVLVDQRQDPSSSNYAMDSRPRAVEDPRLQNGRCCRDDVGDVAILNGVQNLQLLPMEERDSRMSFASNQCIGSNVMLEEPPIKYLAFEKDAKTHKLPIYVQNGEPVAPVDNVEVIKPKMNYRVVSRAQEPAQNIILVPTREQNKVVYVQQPNLSHEAPYEACGHRRKMVLCRQDCQPSVRCVEDSPNVCGLHVPKQNLLGIRSNECEGIPANLQQPDNMKHLQRGNGNWGELRYRPTHGNNTRFYHGLQ